MKQIGGERSELFSVTPDELAKIQDLIQDGELPPPQSIRAEGAAGALVRFRTVDDAIAAAPMIG